MKMLYFSIWIEEKYLVLTFFSSAYLSFILIYYFGCYYYHYYYYKIIFLRCKTISTFPLKNNLQDDFLFRTRFERCESILPYYLLRHLPFYSLSNAISHPSTIYTLYSSSSQRSLLSSTSTILLTPLRVIRQACSF